MQKEEREDKGSKQEHRERKREEVRAGKEIIRMMIIAVMMIIGKEGNAIRNIRQIMTKIGHINLTKSPVKNTENTDLTDMMEMIWRERKSLEIKSYSMI